MEGLNKTININIIADTVSNNRTVYSRYIYVV